MTPPLVLPNQSSLVKKSTTSFIVGITIAAILLLSGNGGDIPWFPPTIVFPLVGVAVLTSLIFPFIWHALERKQKMCSIKIYGLLYSILRYCIALNLASFGWKKLFGLQFLVPDHIAALPMNQQTGEWLTWYYFGYSPAFSIIIALLQILGACLLLSRRTLLFGSAMLLALLLNLTFITIFYQMNLGALLQSVISTLGIMFLLLLDFDRIKAFFFNSPLNIPALTIRSGVLKSMLRFSVILFSLLFTIYLKTR
jgi:hypothetical protein